MDKKYDVSEQLYNMKCGQMICFNNNSSWLRVPGGWVYGDMQGTTFIPFDNEFQVKSEMPSIGDIEVILLGWFDCEMNNKNIMNIAKEIYSKLKGET